MKSLLLASVLCLLVGVSFSQTDSLNTLPYFEIPSNPDEYSDLTIVARMIDGLGFRYYWASKDLRPEDLAYDPGNEGVNCKGVLKHLYGLSDFIVRVVRGEEIGSREEVEMTWEDQRAKTLENFYTASELLKKGDVNLQETNIVFRRGESTNEFPFWNLINGPIADAIYHTGQITSYRRSSGNPIDSNISVFSGRKRG